MSIEAGDLEIYVFPLPKVVLFPATAQPLNIFEPRYVEMVNDAMANDRLIALTSAGVSGQIAGCGAVELLEEREDGTMMILVRSEFKVRIISVNETSKPYLVARAMKISETTDLQPGHVFYLHRMMREVSGWLERNIPQAEETR